MKTLTTYPVNLILEGKRCVVIGGGKIALRKIKGLLNSGAKVHVIAPEICESIKKLEISGRLQTEQREFTETDINDASLVYIVTNSTSLNKEITEICNKKGILCCAADKNWRQGSFITPASDEKDGITVAVSSHGTSCRKTKLIKNNIIRHIDMVKDADLMILGTDHNYLSLEQRENLHLIGGKFETTERLLSHILGIHEYILINTCNRIEIAAVVSPNKYMEELLLKILNFSTLSPASYYIKYGFKAFSHLCVETAGLLSQTPGEKHITAQIKEALQHAKKAGTAGQMMQEWLNNTLHISKHIRQEVEPILDNFEIEDISLRFLHRELSNFKTSKLLVIGTGTVGKGIIERVNGEIKKIYWCYHKNRPENISAYKNCEIVKIQDLHNVLPKVNIIISAVSSTVPVVHHGHAPFIDCNKNLLIMDLSIPRNVSPEIKNLLENVKIVDLDDLKYWFRRKSLDMVRLFEISNAIIEEHKDIYMNKIAGYSPVHQTVNSE